MNTCKCGKCGGKGFLPEYRGIRSGLCFACKGTGEYIDNGNKKYQIGGLFWIKAKSESEALNKAEARFKNKNFDKNIIKITGVM